MFYHELERQPNWQFDSYVKYHVLNNLNNEMELKNLMGKINADFLEATIASINIELH